MTAIAASSCGSDDAKKAGASHYNLTLNAAAQGVLSADPPGPTYADGTLVTLSAAPVPGYALQAWQGTDNDALTTLSNTVLMTNSPALGGGRRQHRYAR